jgi:hypothetical protein
MGRADQFSGRGGMRGERQVSSTRTLRVAILSAALAKGQVARVTSDLLARCGRRVDRLKRSPVFLKSFKRRPNAESLQWLPM